MSEKKRQKKDGEDKNKNDQRMRAANIDVDRGKQQGDSGDIKRRHNIGSVEEAFVDDQNGA